jgi:ribosome modulation factor
MVDYKDIPLPKEMTKRIGNAWRKGYAAFLNNSSKGACPYCKIGMGRAYHNAWIRGWEIAKSEKEFVSD